MLGPMDIPEPGRDDVELTIYTPAKPALYALEINSMLASAYGLEVGMQVEWQ